MKKGELGAGMVILIAVLSIGGLVMLGWQSQVVGQASLNTACCTVAMYQDSPNGYTQGPAKTTTEFCYVGESAKRCCFRAGLEESKYPIKVAGARYGTCGGTPEANYPVFIPSY